MAWIERRVIATAVFNLKHRQSGFSLIEMTLVLAILAIGATTVMRVAQNKMEETITSRTVSELSIAVEAAYECYVADDCATGDPKGWTFKQKDEEDELSVKDYLPNSFPSQYDFSVLEEENKIKANIKVNMGEGEQGVKRAKRVVRAFGSSARVINPDSSIVVVTLGIPGTERAFSAAITKIKAEDFVFVQPSDDAPKSNIEGAGDISAESVTVGGAKITASEVKALTDALRLNCGSEAALRMVNGLFQCGATPPRGPPAPTSCSYRGRTYSIGSSVRVATEACSARCVRPAGLKNCFNTAYTVRGTGWVHQRACGSNGQFGQTVRRYSSCAVSCRTGHDGGKDGSC